MTKVRPATKKNGRGNSSTIVAVVAVIFATVFGAALFVGNSQGLWDQLSAGTPRVLGPVLAAIIAWLGVKKTLDQKREADYRSEWWKRVEWAMGELNSDRVERQGVAIEFLLHLVGEETTPREDASLVATVMNRAVQSAEKLQGEENG